MKNPDMSSASARDEVLQRIRKALSTKGTHHARTDGPPATTDGIPTPTTRTEILALFVERVEDYRADVTRCGAAELAGVLATALAGQESVAVPSGFELTGVSGRLVHEADLADVHALEGVAAVVSTSAVGIAETGTVVLDHSDGQGRRGLTLLPDLHVCVVQADHVVASVPDAMAALRPSIAARRPLTWISGPSATSDIELERVEGVHGPRTLHVILID